MTRFRLSLVLPILLLAALFSQASSKTQSADVDTTEYIAQAISQILKATDIHSTDLKEAFIELDAKSRNRIRVLLGDEPQNWQNLIFPVLALLVGSFLIGYFFSWKNKKEPLIEQQPATISLNQTARPVNTPIVDERSEIEREEVYCDLLKPNSTQTTSGCQTCQNHT